MADRVVPMDVRAAIVNWPEDAPRGAVSRFCNAAGISRSRFYEIRRRAEIEGPVAAMAARPRLYPDPHPQGTPVGVEELAVTIRKELADQGLDHGPVTVRWHLQQLGVSAPATSTLSRIFTRRGMVTPQPQKRPRSSYRRFEFATVHECWQLDAFEWPLLEPLGNQIGVCVIYQILDDHSRFMLATHVGVEGAGENAADAILAMDKALTRAGQVPCLLLSDNGVALNQDRRGRTSQLVAYLRAMGCRPITGRPGHPQTQGKDERAHQTLQRWLRAHPAATPAGLQEVVDAFDDLYNHRRPHQSLGMRTPAQVLAAGPVAIPPAPTAAAPPSTHRKPTTARTYRVKKNGTLEVRRHSIYLELAAGGSQVLVVDTGTTINVFNTQGAHLRTVALIPGKTYYGNGKKSPGAPRRPKSSTLT